MIMDWVRLSQQSIHVPHCCTLSGEPSQPSPTPSHRAHCSFSSNGTSKVIAWVLEEAGCAYLERLSGLLGLLHPLGRERAVIPPREAVLLVPRALAVPQQHQLVLLLARSHGHDRPGSTRSHSLSWCKHHTGRTPHSLLSPLKQKVVAMFRSHTDCCVDRMTGRREGDTKAGPRRLALATKAADTTSTTHRDPVNDLQGVQVPPSIQSMDAPEVQATRPKAVLTCPDRLGSQKISYYPARRNMAALGNFTIHALVPRACFVESGP